MKLGIVFAMLYSIASLCMAADCPELTAAQVAVGYVTLTGTLQVLGVLLVGAGVCFIFSGFIAAFFMNEHLVEFTVWAASVAAIVSGLFVTSDFVHYTTFAGALGLLSAITLSAKIRELPSNPDRLLVVLILIWGMMALYYQHAELGFITVVALVSLFGLSVHIHPLCYGFGFRTDDHVVRGTIGGCLITMLYAYNTSEGTNLGEFEVFRTGSLWIGSFAWLLGLLLLSSRWYSTGSRLIGANFAMLLSLSIAITVGSIWGLREMTTIAGAFAILYSADKIVEVPTSNHMLFGAKLLTAGIGMYWVWDYITKHQDVLVKYLTV